MGVPRNYAMTPEQTKQARKQAREKLKFAEDNWSSELAKELRQSAEQAQSLYRDLNDAAGILDASRALILVEYLEKGWEASRTLSMEQAEEYRRSDNKRGQGLMRLALAEICLQEGRSREALSEACEAQELFHQAGLTELEILSMNRAASAHLKQSNAGDALTTAQEALALAEEFGDMSGEALSLRCVAQARAMAGEVKEALEAAKTSLVIFKQLGDHRKQVTGLLVVAEVYLARDRPQEALRAAKEAKSTAKRHGGMRLEAMALSVISQAMSKGDLPKDALKAAREEQEMYQTLGDRIGVICAMRDVALAKVAKGDKRDAIAVVKEALQLAHDIEDRLGEAKLNLLAAELELDTGRPSDSQRHIEEAIAVYREEGVWRGQADAVRLLMQVLLRQSSSEMFATSEDWRALYFDADDRKGEALALCESARIFMKVDQGQQAETMAAEAQAICQEIEDQRGEAEALLTMGEIHTSTGDANRAVQSAQEALELWKLQGDEKGEVKAMQILAQAQVIIDYESEEAVKNAEQALSLVKRSRKSWATTRDEVSALQVLADVQVQHLLRTAGSEEEESQNRPSNNLAANQEELDQVFEKIINNSTLAVTRAQQTGDRSLEAAMLKCLALNHTVGRSWEGALDAAKEGLKICKDLGDRRQEAYFQAISADVHMNMNLLNKADEEAKAALNIFREFGDEQGEAQAKKVLDDMYGTNKPGRAAAASDVQYAPTDAVGGGGVAQAPSSGSAALKVGPTKEYILENLYALSANIVGDKVEQDSPLMDSGMDSLSSVEFRNQVRGLVPGVNLPASLVFDHPNLRAMTDFIYEKAAVM